VPKISVIMAVYNGELHLRESIESILAQTFTDYEFLIMDDGSDDQTPVILQEYCFKDSRIKVFSQLNRGLGESLNCLIKVSKGKYLARMDADDISEPNRFSAQVDYLEKNLEHAFVVGGSLIINKKGQIISGKYLKDDEIKLRKILFSGEKNPFTHGAIMFRKSCLLELDMIYRFRYSQDFDLLLRLADKYKIGSNECILYRFRQGSTLQNDVVKTKQRLMQRHLLLDIYNAKKIFDDVYCQKQVALIYSESFKINNLATEELSYLAEQCRGDLKLNFFNQDLKDLRELSLNCIKKYGCKKIFLFYLILSFLPLQLSRVIFDALTLLRNRKHDGVIVNLSMKEIEKYFK